MATQVSPGVVINEIDRSDSLTQVPLTEGAFCGSFTWGPVLEVTTVSSEAELATKFGKPNNESATSFFTAANFLAYSNTLRVVRAANTSGLNAIANTNTSANGVLIKNDAHYESSTISGKGAWAAKYPGTLGNALRVEVCGANNSVFDAWGYANLFQAAPGTSTFASDRGAANDEIHIVVVDKTGAISGTANTVLEKFEALSKAADGRTASGEQVYYKDVINNQSAWIWWLAHPSAGTNWGANVIAANGTATSFTVATALTQETLSQGTAGETPSDAEKQAGLDLFLDESVEFSFLMAGEASSTVAAYCVTTIAEPRKYVMAFISPEKADVVNNSGAEVTDTLAFRTAVGVNSSYAVMDSGWKYQYDKYNQLYRWIPLNGDTAGLLARTDQTAESWFSPAGFTRGQYKVGNAVKLAFNPKLSDRNSLYLKQVNPVVAFPGEGTVLFGDKTMQSKTSAFDRINVRRLFIVLEKTIDRSAKYQLFEQNDEFTRNQFINTIEPFLRSVKGRRGISDFFIVCDATNNPQDAVDRNEFRADIYVKPIRSINFIQLNFVAVRSDVSFNEVITNLG